MNKEIINKWKPMLMEAGVKNNLDLACRYCERHARKESEFINSNSISNLEPLPRGVGTVGGICNNNSSLLSLAINVFKFLDELDETKVILTSHGVEDVIISSKTSTLKFAGESDSDFLYRTELSISKEIAKYIKQLYANNEYLFIDFLAFSLQTTAEGTYAPSIAVKLKVAAFNSTNKN